jgi:hypothetical protein
MSALPRAVREPLLVTGTAAWRLASKLRGERAVHGRGTALTGRLTVSGGADTGAALLDTVASYDVVVRLSRAIGLPERLPDVLGLAVRVLDAYGSGQHQDLLMDSSASPPLLRHLPTPGRDHLGVTYSSMLPYRADGRLLLVGARGMPGSPEAPDLRALPPLALGLLVATPRGPWRQVGVVRTTGVLPAPEGRQLRFSIATTGGGLVPAGPLQEWRRRSYPASHVGPDE